jgi:hypothetical protein
VNRIDFRPRGVIVNLMGGDLERGDREHLGQRLLDTYRETLEAHNVGADGFHYFVPDK